IVRASGALAKHQRRQSSTAAFVLPELRRRAEAGHARATRRYLVPFDPSLRWRGEMSEDPHFDLTEHEIEVLAMLNGDRSGEWGSWVAACLEFLAEAGLCTRGPNYQITEAGRAALKGQQP